MNTNRRSSVVLAASLAAIGLVGCSSGNSSGVTARPQAAATSTESAESELRMADSDLDALHPRDEAFFANFRLSGASMLRPPVSLEDAALEADAVVLARVRGVRTTRQIGTDEGDRTSFSLTGVELDVVEVLAGELNPAAPVPVVEFLQASDEPLTGLRSDLPQGTSIWFLNWQGVNRINPAVPTSKLDKKFYDLLSMQGLLSQHSSGVVSILGETEELLTPPSGTMAFDARKYSKMSEAALVSSSGCITLLGE